MGAIALGYLLAQTISHFVNIFASPVVGWLTRRQYAGLAPKDSNLPGFSFKDALPDLARFVVLLSVWFALVYWLYFKPLEKENQTASSE